jgi:PAS domain S-box-containing protein
MPPAPLSPEPADLFENAFHNAAIGMALVGLDGRFLKVNGAFCRLVGFPPERMLALDFQTLTHPQDLNADLALLGRLTAGDIPNYEMDKRYLRADGSTVWVRLSVSLVSTADGAPQHYIAQVQDLSARREAEARYRLLEENISDMVSLRDLYGRYLYVSPSSLQLLGYTPEEMIGATPEALDLTVDPADLDYVRERVRAAPGAPIDHCMRVRRKDGAVIWVEFSARLVSDEGRPVIVATSRDVTARVETQAALEAKSRDLEAAGKAALAAMNTAKAAAAAKSEFLANMSHEIRTPLTAIVGFADLLTARQGLDGGAASHVERISTASRALRAIVNDVLDFSRLEAGQVEIAVRPTAVADLARGALMMFEAQALAKGLTMTLEVEDGLPEHLAVDADRLRQILVNLLGNALKFTDAGGVRVRLRHDGGRLHLAVTDTGAGLSLAQQKKLFQRFSQVDGSSARSQGGAGLGLAICKGLAEAMGGGVSLRSRRGEGSTFHVQIDAPACAAPRGASPEEPVLTLQGVRVLVVDDNPANRELARTVLRHVGVVVDEADGGAAAVQAAMTTPYDVILMDIRMPGMDGHAALAKIRSCSGPNQEIPILAFSADAKFERLTSGAHRFDDLVRKPLKAATLAEVIAKWARFSAYPASSVLAAK